MVARPVDDEHGTLGGDYWRLWGSSTISTLGDGIYITALLLIGARLTSDPVQLSLLSIAATLPALLFALLSGALVDRFDHRRVMWVTDTVRFGILGLLAVLLLGGHATIWLLVAVSFLLAVGETLYVTAAQSIVPRIVSRAPSRLQRANSRLTSAQILFRDFIGRPAGGALVGVVMWLPVALDAASFGLAALLISRVRGPGAAPARPDTRDGLFREVGQGLRWLWRHRLLRTLALAVSVDNLAFVAWNAVLVLMLKRRFGLGGLEYGALTACLGLGGITGSLAMTRLSARLGQAPVLVAAMVLEGIATAALGLAPHPIAAAAAMVLIGASAVGWNVVSVSLRQSLVPMNLQGRVNGAYRLVAVAGAPVGAALGGLLARSLGLTAPFLVGAGATLVMSVAVARIVNRRTVEAALAEVT